ncbi:DNA alkylation repair protein [Paenibacillus polymyxa]|uniref:DNA alkylation repair protein n=1 Tax=Paenibacillus polymyxa TaxID=1406 RepID=UPI0025B70313|nr:DNA alkylation repair protein [Paenibacillus polymyxa]MDN4086085.1 DNA alkylation repair protein [Paenibacillus polymyxa]MDN4087082.1 DNA alkylation repair protein [Paenibacillus polymyxa]MDN4108704.1 DNA alkylation repair protein [Paenibacillus polymyxa]
MLHRKGARKRTDIPTDVLQLLQQGQLETVNLTEWLAVDHIVLLRNALDEFGLQRSFNVFLTELDHLKEKKIMKIIPAIAQAWLHVFEQQTLEERTRIYDAMASHLSDSIRCWAAYIIGVDSRLSLEEKLAGIRPFAADSHFGVREIAWMAMREPISLQLDEALVLLNSWMRNKDANIRRFAIELTRPQGVWAKHIPELKEHPELALPLLEVVQSDPVKYVQDSVGNWLNDASKTNPEWVIQVCDTWLLASDTKETKRIVTRAQRSLNKMK